jgi:hypothetical protein
VRLRANGRELGDDDTAELLGLTEVSAVILF